jgi:cytochrome c-type biogenesis protein CcmF
MFEGELTAVGNLGYLCAILGFAAALISCIAFIKSANTEFELEKKPWQKIARTSFYIHVLGTFMVFGILFYLIFNHRYEFAYVWNHSNNQLPFKYLLSCFWEGQEGSFLLWLIWHCVLGIVVILFSKKWQSPVMAVVTGVQAILGLTILGIYFGKFQLGTSPFILLRHQMAGIPIFSSPDYLKNITDGKGLNPLLQNYWMVIHPPVLFLGFASTLIPFAYAIAGLWKRNFTEWVRPALTWSLFGMMVLGTGIIMGGAWAYESLSFGGYWAWDPVENASLVPWLTLVAGVHTLSIYKHSNYSLKTTLIFFMLTFFLVIYSTYLTRTGILGETSVHAFTGEGASLSIHLIIFLSLIAISSATFYITRQKSIVGPAAEEATWSREFWMYIGSLILLISAIQITVTTSIPVWNKMFSLKMAPPADVMGHYNRIQIWVAVLLGLGTAFVHFLKYKNSKIGEILKKQIMPLIVTSLLTLGIAIYQNINVAQILIMLFACFYAVVGNIFFMTRTKMSSLPKLGSTTAHVGFGLMLLGILLSSFNKHVISENKLGIDLGLPGKTPQEQANENGNNVLLYRNTPSKMGDYTLTYQGDSVLEPNHYYKVRYQRIDSASGKVLEEFMLCPNAQVNPKMGLISSPGTKHYWDKDIFTYITKAQEKSSLVDTVSYTNESAKVGDTMFYGTGFMVYKGIEKNINAAKYNLEPNDVAFGAMLDLHGLAGKVGTAMPLLIVRNGNQLLKIEDTVEDANLFVRIANIDMKADKALVFEFKQPSAANDYIVMKALVFPHINILAIGAVIMALGTFLALWHRLKGKNI